VSFIHSFLDPLLNTLGIGIGTFFTFVFICLIGFIFIGNFEFFVNFFNAFVDWLLVQLSKSHILANGTYYSMRRKLKSAIKETRDLQAELEGQKQEMCITYQQNKDEYNKAKEKASFLKSDGNTAEALFYAKKALKLEQENEKIINVDIPDLEAAADAADRKIARLHEEIETLKHDRKSTDKIRRTTDVLEKANRTLIGDNTEVDEQILENYREHVNARRIKAQGREVVLSKAPNERAKALDDKILSKKAEDFLKHL